MTRGKSRHLTDLRHPDAPKLDHLYVKINAWSRHFNLRCLSNFLSFHVTVQVQLPPTRTWATAHSWTLRTAS